MPSLARLVPVSLALLLMSAIVPAAAQEGAAVPAETEQTSEAEAHELLIRTAIAGRGEDRRAALDALVEKDAKDAIGPLIVGMRHIIDDLALRAALSALTGEEINSWHQAMLWQERNPDVVPHKLARDLKLLVFSRIDPRFLRFVGGERSEPENMRIRFEEVVWGGVVVDGIPSLDNPAMIAAADADYMGDDNLVFGVSINGDARAYPLRIMGWHEMFNDVIGGVPVALAYCTLCGAGILYETDVEGQDETFVFGSSGFLYRSNKLMFDRQTDSLWNQFTGEPVSGPLVDSGIKLKLRPVTVARWADWRARHPETTVLSLDTGFNRNYGEGVTYNAYFASPDLMFPAHVSDESVVARKDFIFGIRDVGAQKAWPLAAFETEPVINDMLSGRNLVLVGNAQTRDVRAYERGARMFTAGPDAETLTSDGQAWSITEDALVGPGGEELARVAGHIAYWFGWNSYYGVSSELYEPQPG